MPKTAHQTYEFPHQDVIACGSSCLFWDDRKFKREEHSALQSTSYEHRVPLKLFRTASMAWQICLLAICSISAILRQRKFKPIRGANAVISTNYLTKSLGVLIITEFQIETDKQKIADNVFRLWCFWYQYLSKLCHSSLVLDRIPAFPWQAWIPQTRNDKNNLILRSTQDTEIPAYKTLPDPHITSACPGWNSTSVSRSVWRFLGVCQTGVSTKTIYITASIKVFKFRFIIGENYDVC